MKTLQCITHLSVVAVALLAAVAHAEDNKWPGTKEGEATPNVKSMPKELAKTLAAFDDLDFRVYTGQQWQDFHKTHAKDVVVHWPDGHIAKGLEKHIQDLKYMWTFAPDNRIKEHPVRFGTGRWRVDCGRRLAGGHLHQADGPP